MAWISGMVDWIPEEMLERHALPQVRGFILTSDAGRKTQGLTVLAEGMASLESALQ